MAARITWSLLTAMLLLGTMPNASLASTSETTAAQKTEDLLYIREEEKLARDIYLMLHEKWSGGIFSNIANSEQQHMDAMLRLLRKFKLADPAAGKTIGEFTNDQLQDLYDTLLKLGLATRLAALKVGGIIEETDIRDLARAIDDSQLSSIDKVYSRLLCGSRNHLRAFARNIQRVTGEAYVAQVLTQDEVDSILGGETESCGRTASRGGPGAQGVGRSQGQGGLQPTN